jgi:gliding motility-associated-like protein
MMNLVFSQVQSPDCASAEAVCNSNGTSFPLSIGSGAVNDIPSGNNISNPGVNPQGVNSGCLFSNELNPNWFIINIGSSGNLEFTIGAAGGSGFFDWSLWPYNPNTACAGIQNNTLAPVACNWNGSASGYTGMWNGGTPPGGSSVNFQPSLNVLAGQQYVLVYSNYSGLGGNSTLSFPTNPGSAAISCTSTTPDQTICQGAAATVNLNLNPALTNPTVNWLVTTNVSNTSGTANVQVSPSVTTLYQVQVLEGTVPVDTIEFTIIVVPPPVPNAGIDDTVCLGQPIYLTGVISSPTNTPSWQFSTAGITPVPTVTFAPNFNSLTPTVTVNQVGLYSFILRENNTICGMRRDTVRVLVTNITQTTTYTPPSCGGLSDATITITSPLAEEYSFNNGTTWQTAATQGGFAAGTYTVCSRNFAGCQTCSQVVVIDPPVVTISASADTLICENGTATLIASATGGTSYTFNWDHTTNTGATQLVNPLANTTYTVYATNQNNCDSPVESIVVNVRNPITGTISIEDTICPGYPTTLSATAVGGIGAPFTFVWSTAETGVGTDHTISNVNPSYTTTYTVTVEDVCESTPLVMTTRVVVAPLPIPLISTDINNVCEPAVFNLTNETDPTMVQDVFWSLSNGDMFQNQSTVTTSPMWDGLYDVQLIVTSPQGCIDSTTFYNYLNVYPKPIADFRYSPNPVMMFNTKVKFVNYSINGDTYQWFFTDGNPSYSAMEDPTVFYPDGVTGQYDVMLITTSEFGCVDTAMQTVIVLPEILLYAPNAFTPDNDEFNQDWGISISGVDIYDFQLLIFNRWGEIIWESNDPAGRWDGTYNGTRVQQGVYTWTIRTKDVINDAKYEWNGFINVLK